MKEIFYADYEVCKEQLNGFYDFQNLVLSRVLGVPASNYLFLGKET